MPRPAPDPRKVDRAWELVVIRGETYQRAAQIIGEEFDCPPPAASTAGLWAKENRQLRECYGHLMDLEENREYAAFRHRQLWSLTYNYMLAGEIPFEKGIRILLKVVEEDRKLFGMDAATKVFIQNTPPGVDERILTAVKAFHAQDKAGY